MVGPPEARETGSSTGWATPATATPSTATTSPWRPTRPATCWRSTPSTGWRSWPCSPATHLPPLSGTSAQRNCALAINATLRRSDGIYVDGVDASGAQSGHASQEANALALAYGVVPASDIAKVVAYVAGLGISVEPNHGLELLRGLAAAGRPDLVVRTLTDTSIPGWAHVVAAGGTFTWEVWRPSDLIGDSMSHGWGSSALVAMQETLLGVTHLEPGPGGTVRLVGRSPDHRTPAGLGLASHPGRHGDGVLAAAWLGHDARLDPAGQRLGDGPPAFLGPVGRARGRRRRGQGGRASRSISTDNGMAVLTVGSGTYHFTTS